MRHSVRMAMLFLVISVLSSACSHGSQGPANKSVPIGNPDKPSDVTPSTGAHETPGTSTGGNSETSVPSDKKYAEFQALNQALASEFQPKGFELFNHREGDATYYGFDAELAWGKRRKTTLDGDDSKPTQTEYIYIEKANKIANVVEIMYVPQLQESDVVGFLSVPTQEARLQDGTNLKIEPPQSFIQIFSYRHFVVLIESFGNSTADGMSVVNSNKAISLEFRSFIERHH